MLLTCIDYEFDKDTIKFNEDGKMVDVTKLVLHAPTMKDLPIISKLKQLIMRAQLQAYKIIGKDGFNSDVKDEVKEDEEDEDKKPSGILSTIYMGEVDVNHVFELFNDLVLDTGRITVNNTKTNFNKAMQSQLNPVQYEAIVDLYLSAFMQAS